MTANEQEGIELTELKISELKQTTVEPKNISEEIKKQTIDLEKTFKELNTLQEKNLKIDQELFLAEVALKEAQKAAENTIRSLVGGRSIELSPDEKKATNEIDGLKSAKAPLLEQIQAHQKAIEDGVANLEGLMTRKIELSANEIKELTGSNSDLSSSIESLKGEISNNTQQIEQQQMQINDTEAKIQRYQETKSKLQLALNTLDTELETKLRDAAEIKDKAIETAKKKFDEAFESEVNKNFNAGIKKIHKNYNDKIASIEQNPELNPKDKLIQLREAKLDADNDLNTLNLETKEKLNELRVAYKNDIKSAYETFGNEFSAAKGAHFKAVENINKQIEENEKQFPFLPSEVVSPTILQKKTLENIGLSIQKHQNELETLSAQIMESSKDLAFFIEIQEAKEEVAKQQIEQQQAIIERLEEKNTNLQTDLDLANKTNSANSELIKDLSSQNDELKNQIELEKNAKVELQHKLDDALKTINSLNEKLGQLSKTNKELNDILIEQKARIESQNNEIQNLQGELTTANGKISNLESSVTNLKSQLELSKKTIEALTEENDKLNSNLNESQEQLKNIQKKLDQIPKNTIESAAKVLSEHFSQQDPNTYNVDIENLKNPTIEILSRIIEKYNNLSFPDDPLIKSIQDNLKIQGEIKDILAEKEEVGNKLKKSQLESNELSRRIGEQNTDIASLKETNNNLDKKISDLSKVNGELIVAKNVNELTIELQLERIVQLEESLSEERRSAATIKNDLISAQSQIGDIQSELINSKESIVDLKGQVNAITLENKRLTLALDEQQKELDGLKNDKETISDKIEKLILEQTTLKPQIAQGNEKIKELQEIDALTEPQPKDLTLLQEQIKILEGRYNENQNALTEATEKLVEYTGQIEDLANTISKGEAEKARLASTSNELETQNDSISQHLNKLLELTNKLNMKLFHVELNQNTSPSPSSENTTINIPTDEDVAKVYQSGIQLKHKDSGLSYTFKIEENSGIPQTILDPSKSDTPLDKEKTAKCIMNMINNVLANGNEVNIKTPDPFIAAIARDYLDCLQKEMNLTIKNTVEFTGGPTQSQEKFETFMPQRLDIPENNDMLNAIKEQNPTQDARKISTLNESQNPLQPNTEPKNNNTSNDPKQDNINSLSR